MSADFKFVERGYQKTLVLIPGWATDYRIFSGLELNYNYLLPIKTPVLISAEGLLKALDKELINRISLFGWSMGGFQALDLALKCPLRVEEIILSGVRKQYDPLALEEIGLKIKSNKKAFLRRFYSECFSSSANDGWAWFKDNLLQFYLDDFRVEELLEGLKYLSQASISLDNLSSINKVMIFHGEQDKISPIEEINEIRSKLSEVKFINIKGAGHIPFFSPEFKGYFSE